MEKKLLIIVIALFTCCAVNAQNKKGKNAEAIVQDEWNDVEIFEQHKLYPRANVVPYANENAIEKNDYAHSPYYVSLNGEWHMDLKKGFANRPTNMEQKDFSAAGWPTVVVPSARWSDGSKTVSAPQVKSAVEMPSSNNYVATYYKEFNVPKTWKGYKAFLNLQAKSAYYIWVNQEYVGYSEDSRDISEFELTKHLRYGKTNNIVVQVVSVSDGSMLESNYARNYNGITSDVFIVLKPMVNVLDMQITADYDAASSTGSFLTKLNIFNESKKGQYYVEVELWDTKGHQLDKMGRWVVFDKKNELEIKFDRTFGGILSWSAETPNMYTMVVRLRDKKMELIETVGSRFGFRTVEVKDGLLKVNGMPVTLRGTVYSFFSNEKDGIPSESQIRNDLKLMKQYNINAVRTALYSPASPLFYQLCDEYGLYVICDANIQPFSATSKAVATDKAYINMFISRVQNMYERFKNHPSVIAWSLGDGVDNGICMEQTYRALKQKDKSRPVLFPGAGYSDNTDAVAPAYLDYDDLKLFAAKQQPRPLILSAFGSAKGNSYGNLEPMWQLVRRHSSLQGGFATYWNFADCYDVATHSDIRLPGLVTDDGRPMPYLSELRNIYRPFDVQLMAISPDAAEFNVTNYLSFLTLNDYILEYTIFSNLKNRIIEGEVSVSLKPGESKNFKLKIPALTLYAGEELFIRFTVRQRKDTEAVPKGTELGVVEFPLPMKEIKKEKLSDYDREELFVTKANTNEDNGVIQLFNDNIELWYDLNMAEIVAYKFHDRDLLLSSPQVNFWRAPTDNDRVDKNALRLWQNIAPDNMRRTVVATNYRQIDAYTVGIDAMLRYTDASGNVLFDVKQSIAVLYTGDVLIDNEIVATEQVKTLPKVGMQMCLSRQFDTVRWFGLDKETYSDRRSSGVAGTYKRAANSMFFKYDKPQESGNRAGVRWVSVENGNIGFYVDLLDTNFNFSIYPYTDLQLSESTGSGSLKEQDFWTFNVDYRQAAVGSALAGTHVSDNNLVDARSYHFRMHMRAYNLDEYNPYDFCRVQYPEIVSSVLPMPVITKSLERFDRPMTITLSSSTPKSEIHYTLDGSTPDLKSPLYKKPFVIENSTYVKAKVFKNGSTPSFTAVKRFNFDYIVNASFVNKSNTPYNYNQETILFDGENGDISELSRGWLGFSGNDLNVVLELSKPIELQQVVVNFAHVPDAWAFAPIAVQAFVSSDGVNYSPAIAAKLKYAPEEESMNKPQLVTVTIDVNKPEVKYVRLVATNMGRIPTWHKAKGLRPWIMVDEIQLNEVIK
ncbi:MAG: chitobiase/beta-hexosaminidase C-terminal domain-containing protein [Bacteroidales bacterium]|nr:chitobiase/beta-hexosaminidase C-terminal domain-containing protein [Bacteroidales bacterium]